MPTTATAWKPAYLADAGLRKSIRFQTPMLRLTDGEERVISHDGQPIMHTVEGEIFYFVRRNDHRPHPIIEFRVIGNRRTFTSRPDLNIEIAD